MSEYFLLGRECLPLNYFPGEFIDAVPLDAFT